MSLILARINYLLELVSVFSSDTRTQKGYCCHSPESYRYFVSTDVTFLSPSYYFPQLVSVYLLISSLVVRGRGHFCLLLFQFLCLLLLLKYLWLPHLTLLCRFISDLKINALYLIAPILHLLCSRFLLPHPLFPRLMIYLLLYEEVDVLVLNTQLLILCLIIVFHLVYILDGNML